MKIELKTNYNTLLFHHVDSISLWDTFVSKHHNDYFKENFIISSSTNEILKTYSKIRSQLGWNSESELFEWAYNGFKIHKQFSKLLKPIHFMENIASKNGKTIKTYLEEELEGIVKKEKLLNDMQLKFEDRSDEILKVYNKLFYNNKDISTDCYVTHSPYENRLQGGANGDSIYIESYSHSNDISLHTISTIYHESFHKILKVRRVLEKVFTETNKKYLTEVIPDLYPSPAHKYLDEVIVYTLTNVLIFNTDPFERISQYSNKGEHAALHYGNVWRGVTYFKYFIEGTLHKPIPYEDFMKELTRLFEQFINEKAYLEKQTR